MLHVDTIDDGAVWQCSIDRPAKRNAVDTATLHAITDAVEAAVAARARVVVLCGRGGVFSAGADLAGLPDGLADGTFAAALSGALARLADAPLVTLAAVDGVALGGGLQLATFCDLRTATAESRFGVPAAKLGIAVDQATIARLVELCGGGAARAMLLAAEAIDGQTAHALGLVSRLCGVDDAMAWARSIAQLAPLTIAAHKAALRAVRLHGSGAIDPDAAAAMRAAMRSEDLVEGRAAFLERRSPVFRGR